MKTFKQMNRKFIKKTALKNKYEAGNNVLHSFLQVTEL